MPDLTLYADDIHNLIVVTDMAIYSLQRNPPLSETVLAKVPAKIDGLTTLRDKLSDRLTQNLHPVRESRGKPGTMLTVDVLLAAWEPQP